MVRQMEGDPLKRCRQPDIWSIFLGNYMKTKKIGPQKDIVLVLTTVYGVQIMVKTHDYTRCAYIKVREKVMVEGGHIDVMVVDICKR